MMQTYTTKLPHINTTSVPTKEITFSSNEQCFTAMTLANANHKGTHPTFMKVDQSVKRM
jgi:hypothetical protein